MTPAAPAVTTPSADDQGVPPATAPGHVPPDDRETGSLRRSQAEELLGGKGERIGQEEEGAGVEADPIGPAGEVPGVIGQAGGAHMHAGRAGRPGRPTG